MFKKIIKWWLVECLPTHYVDTAFKSKNIVKNFLIHPIKRRLAKYYLILLKKFFGLKVIAITGSAGKTTTKDMIATILGQKNKVIYSYANIDPVFNLPTTILKCLPGTKYLVLEMGVEYPGDMDFYLWMVHPDIGVITNIHSTHTLFFGDENGVATEKTKLVKALNSTNVAVLNHNNSHLLKLRGNLKSKIVWFNKLGEISAEEVKLTDKFITNFKLSVGDERVDIQLPVFGSQFVENAITAAAVCTQFKIKLRDIKTGLEKFQSPPHRMKILYLKNNLTVIDDSYNNNPKAAEEFVKNISKFKSKNKLLVIGDMLELGEKEVEFHLQLAKEIAKANFTCVIGVGKLSVHLIEELKSLTQSRNIYSVHNWENAYKIINKEFNQNVAIFVKGSRSIGLDKLVDKLAFDTI